MQPFPKLQISRLPLKMVAGVVLLPLSGFRNVARQAFVFTQPNAAQLACFDTAFHPTHVFAGKPTPGLGGHTDLRVILVLLLVLVLDFHSLWRHAAWHVVWPVKPKRLTPG